MVEILQKFGAGFSYLAVALANKTVGAIANSNSQPFLDLSNMLVKLAAETGQASGIVWLQHYFHFCDGGGRTDRLGS